MVFLLTTDGTVSATVAVVNCNSMFVDHCSTGRLAKIVLALIVSDSLECEGKHTCHSFARTTNSSTWLFWKISSFTTIILKVLMEVKVCYHQNLSGMDKLDVLSKI